MRRPSPGPARWRVFGLLVAVGALLVAVAGRWRAELSPAPPASYAAPAGDSSAPAGSNGERGAPAPSLPPEELVIVNVVKKVRPSRVNIDTEARGRTPFGIFPEQGAGSGVIIRPDGDILTNDHVIRGATAITATVISGKRYPGRVVGTDPLADLAVIKVQAPGPLPAARLGNSSTLQIGQLAIAIGNPFGLGSTATTGVISAIRTSPFPDLAVDTLIQTSAAINPGNSGGRSRRQRGPGHRDQHGDHPELAGDRLCDSQRHRAL